MTSDIQVLTLESIWQMTLELAKDIQKSNFQPDILIGIARGGLVVTRLLSDLLEIANTAVIGVGFYKGINETSKEPRLTQNIDVELKKQKILLIDDVSDTGKSMEFAFNYLKMKEIGELRTAALHYKPNSIFKPNFYIELTSSWIVYPWEYKEFTRLFYTKEKQTGKDKKYIKKKLLALGIPNTIVEDI
ncbi:MAG: phosphoribosyltransferase [Candidatus Heimdallarchaeota archaeon]